MWSPCIGLFIEKLEIKLTLGVITIDYTFFKPNEHKYTLNCYIYNNLVYIIKIIN